MPGPEHLGADPVGGRRDHVVVEGVFDLGPPVVVEEAPEPVGGLVDRDAVGQDAVEVDVRVDEPRHDHVVVAAHDIVVWDGPGAGRRWVRRGRSAHRRRARRVVAAAPDQPTTSQSARTSVISSHPLFCQSCPRTIVRPDAGRRCVRCGCPVLPACSRTMRAAGRWQKGGWGHEPCSWSAV